MTLTEIIKRAKQRGALIRFITLNGLRANNNQKQK